MTAPVCLITGVGPGTGSALARRFAEGGYRVAMLARNEERLNALEKQLPNARGYRCDVSDPAQIETAASAVERDLGEPAVVIHNAVGGGFGTFRDIDPALLNRNFQINTMGLLYLARRFTPAMLRAGKGAFIATGNTSALRGRPASPVLRRPRRRSGFSPKRWRAISGRRACTLRIWSSMP
jgi:NAD(P)-dependent dehydrogenase (short-subunit alcohol dehydrogenase family)